MNKRLPLLMFATTISCLFLGCSYSHTHASVSVEATDDNQNKDIKHHQTAGHGWLHYADPKTDANLAIEKQDFKLLAFAGRATSFPGIDNEASLLQEQCGYRLLTNSTDALRSPDQLELRKQLFQYAAIYNQLVAAACQKNNQR